MIRRTLTLLAAGAVLLATGALSACQTGASDAADSAPAGSAASADAGAFPVTIHNANFGDITITSRPTRVATLGAQDTDNVLSLGVVPVGMPEIGWGGDDQGSTPWVEQRLQQLGASMPTQYSDADSVPIDEIAKAAPDIILATNYSLTQDQYDKLSKIAPVVAYPGAAWTTTWQQALALDGQALGLTEEATRVADRAQQAIDEAKAANPELAGKTFIWGALSAADLSSVSFYTPEDGRPRFLTELGMRNAAIIERLSKKGQFYGTVSAERSADLDSDLFLSYVEKPAEKATYEGDRLIGQIPAIKAGHLAVFLGDATGLAVSVPTPLSIPYLVDHAVPTIVAALR